MLGLLSPTWGPQTELVALAGPALAVVAMESDPGDGRFFLFLSSMLLFKKIMIFPPGNWDVKFPTFLELNLVMLLGCILMC